MNQFIRSVDEMDSTVLVPRRLMDIPAVQLQRQRKQIEVDSPTEPESEGREVLHDNIDLFKFYTMLVETRDELLCGGADESNSTCRPIVKQLQQFSRIFNDLTDMAIQLKERYEYDVNNGSGRNSPN